MPEMQLRLDSEKREAQGMPKVQDAIGHQLEVIKRYGASQVSRARLWRQQLRRRILEHYSEGTMKCLKCGFSDIRALCIDHVNGGGNRHRKEVGDGRLYRWLEKNGFPDGFQVLCHNCNAIKRNEEDMNAYSSAMRVLTR